MEFFTSSEGIEPTYTLPLPKPIKYGFFFSTPLRKEMEEWLIYILIPSRNLIGVPEFYIILNNLTRSVLFWE